ncbi:hypothetical protein BW733_12350 [Tessaracoccus flavescens]|uniref:Uncharacterized protein n=1 Tax=Tessaracoccus flavescens TaxID=399497 RepID=A0A1Q2CZE2_9ACTN|nr:hypothetical protein BW733_12350 [Tessaracoccus flavescens]
MAERERRAFHHEFTTLRFRPLAEHGTWDGRAGYVPGLGWAGLSRRTRDATLRGPGRRRWVRRPIVRGRCPRTRRRRCRR